MQRTNHTTKSQIVFSQLCQARRQRPSLAESGSWPVPSSYPTPVPLVGRCFPALAPLSIADVAMVLYQDCDEHDHQQMGSPGSDPRDNGISSTEMPLREPLRIY